MNSNRQKREKLKLKRDKKRADDDNLELLSGLKTGTIIPVDKDKVFSRSVMPDIPDYYRDKWFTCKDCGEEDLWTAKRQQRWYEEQGGEIESIAVRCRTCRHKEKERRDSARKIHLEGIALKKHKPEIYNTKQDKNFPEV